MAKKKVRRNPTRTATCRIKSCRKGRAEGSTLCEEHSDPANSVRRLDESELLKLGKISAEMEAALLKAKLAGVQVQELRARAEEDIRKKGVERQEYLNEARRLKASYDTLTTLLATKYEIDDPNKMVVDPDTGVIRDLRDT